MGMSLPLLVRGLVRDEGGAPRTIGLLYGSNALGASFGAALTPWVLLRFLGVTGAILVGASGSAIAGLGALVLARGRAEETPGRRDEAAPPSPSVMASSLEAPQPLRVWVVLYALSGFVSLSLEVAWFRVLDVTAKGGAFAFGTLLSMYLLGLAGGTFVAARRRAPARRPLALFLTCQAGIVLVTALAHALLVWLPKDWPLISWVVGYGATLFGVRLPSANPGDFLMVYLVLPLILFGPSTFLMGFGFPILQEATQADPVTSGRTVGLLQAANIAGCTLGSLLTGLLLLNTIGTSGVFRVLILVAAGIAAFGFKTLKTRRLAALGLALLILAAGFPSNDRLWLRLHGDPDPSASFVEEDAASVTLLTPDAARYKLWINGRLNSWLPYGWLHTAIGALAAIASPTAQDVAVIGLGSGDTAWAAASREETRHVTVFEIASSQPRLIQRVASEPSMGRLREFMADTRIAIVKDDGRQRLRADLRLYDIIVADAMWTDTTMSNNLHSLDYYELVRDRLKPLGLMCILARTARVREAVLRVFPYRVSFGSDLLLVSSSPITIDKDAWLARARSPRFTDYLGKARTREIAGFIRAAAYVTTPRGSGDVNRDLDPKDEFLRPDRVRP
jgi:predicted membrane-bound spermidine synthase